MQTLGRCQTPINLHNERHPSAIIGKLQLLGTDSKRRPTWLIQKAKVTIMMTITKNLVTLLWTKQIVTVEWMHTISIYCIGHQQSSNYSLHCSNLCLFFNSETDLSLCFSRCLSFCSHSSLHLNGQPHVLAATMSNRSSYITPIPCSIIISQISSTSRKRYCDRSSTCTFLCQI